MGKYILNFNEINKDSLPLVGGKGANLGEMTSAGFPVPQGFCVTTFAYQSFIQTSQEMNDYFKSLDHIKPDALEEIRVLGKKIRNHLENISMPNDIKLAILNGWKRTGEHKSYAIRSSATAEDLPTASFAGQQDTYLNVKGEEQILRAIQNCWASLFTDRAISYRAKNRFDHRSVFLSVVVQEMVFPEVSGIMFTSDPITGHRNTISIDASFGLGEALVSGLVSADLYQIRNGEMVKKQISKKKIAIYSLPEGGTETKELSAIDQEKQALSDDKIYELASIGQTIEKHYEVEQDVEWCLADGKFYIVQSRPITSLYPLPKCKDEDLHVLFSFAHQQMMTDAMKPLALSIWRTFLPFGKIDSVREESNVMLEAGGRLFVDPTDLLRWKPARKILTKALGGIDERISSAISEVIERNEFQGPPNPLVKRKIIRTIRPIGIKVIKNILSQNNSSAVRNVNNYMKQKVNASECYLNEVTGAERISRIQENIGTLMLSIFSNAAHYVLTGIVASKIIENTTKKWLENSHDIHLLNKSLSGNVTSEMGLLIGDLADLARKSPELIDYLKHAQDNTFLEGLNKIPNSREFHDKLLYFMNQFGMRCPGEIDITNPRWRESPSMLVASILSHIRSVAPGEHRSKFVLGELEANQIANELLQKVGKTRGGLLKKRFIAWMIGIYRDVMGLREHPKYIIVQHLDIYKKAILEEGELLVEEGILDNKEDVFYLSLKELILLLNKNLVGNVQDLIDSRKNQFELDQKRTPPRVMTSEGEIVTGKTRDIQAPKGALVGTAVSAGIVEGYARVVRKPEEANLHQGEILVAPFTDPGWTTLFHSAKGLIMEVGGMMTHGAVVAREYGIPAVVSIDQATEVIKDGDYIRLDGTQGYVLILDVKNNE